MSDIDEITIKYLVYNTYDEAEVKADEEGARRNYSYHINGEGTRYHTKPHLTTSNKYALNVTDYVLTEEEEATVVNSVTLA